MKNNNDEIEKIIPSSPNFQTELAQKIAEIVPEAMSDGKIDVVKLRELINGDVENSPEKFGLFWPGKARAQAVAQIPTSATLVPAPEESVDWENTKNIFIEGDNLETLKILQNSYRRKVKMIYIDPPYNTGKDFIYPDKFSEGLRGYLEYTGQKNEAGEATESKIETGGRRHSNWLSMMYPRLQLAKTLLVDDGIIFISIGDDEESNLRKLCDEVFGEDNFIAKFIWEKTQHFGRQKINTYSNGDYIICYGRNLHDSSGLKKELLVEYVKNDFEDAPLYNASNPSKVLTFPPESTIFNIKDGVYTSTSDDKYQLLCPVTVKNGTNINEFQLKFSSRWSAQTVLDECDKGTKYWIKTENFAVRAIYAEGKLSNESSKQIIFTNNNNEFVAKNKFGIKVGTNEDGSSEVYSLFNKTVFSYPKPSSLVEYFFSLSDGEIFMDFFAGSATSAQAVMQLNAFDGGNRKYILVQLPEDLDESFKTNVDKNERLIIKNALEICETIDKPHKLTEISKERIRRAGKKILEDYAEKLKKRKEPLDVGFRVYKLAPSNFVQWDEEKAKENIQQSILDFADNKKSNTSPEAILSEIMLQNKITLDAKIEKKQLSNDGWVYVVDDGNLIAYVNDKQITEDQAKEIAEMTPGKLIVVDSAFNGNDALKINVANICKEKFIKEFKTI